MSISLKKAPARIVAASTCSRGGPPAAPLLAAALPAAADASGEAAIAAMCAARVHYVCAHHSQRRVVHTPATGATLPPRGPKRQVTFNLQFSPPPLPPF